MGPENPFIYLCMKIFGFGDNSFSVSIQILFFNRHFKMKKYFFI
jgi:hypothetical protein